MRGYKAFLTSLCRYTRHCGYPVLMPRVSFLRFNIQCSVLLSLLFWAASGSVLPRGSAKQSTRTAVPDDIAAEVNAMNFLRVSLP